MAVDVSGGGAIGVLFDDAPGPTAVQDPVGAENRFGDHPAETRTLDQAAADLLSWPGGRGVERVGQDRDPACHPAAQASDGLTASPPFAPRLWR